MKVIHYIGNLSILRGLEKQAIIQCQALIEKGVECQLWTLTSSSECEEIVSNQPNLSINVLAPRWLPLKEYVAMLSVFILLSYSRFGRKSRVIHLHGLSRSCLPILLLASAYKKKIVIKLTNSGDKSVFLKMNKQGPLARYVIRLARTNAASWICLNKTAMADAKSYGIESRKLISIPNICPHSYVNRPSRPFKDCADINILFSGAMTAHKHPEIALEVARLLSGKQNIRFHFAGEGPMLKTLKQACPNNTTFYGKLCPQELAKLLSLSHIYISTSSAEGMSNSLLEAIAYGLIPVVSAIEANSNVLGSDYPYLNSPRATDYANSIMAIVRDDVKPIHAQSILSRYSSFNVSRLLMNLYQEVVSKA